MALRRQTAYTPLQKRICRIRSDLMFEFAFDIRADHDILHWIAQQVAHEERYIKSDRVSELLAPVLPFCDLIVGTEEEVMIAGGIDRKHCRGLFLLRLLVAVRRAEPPGQMFVK
jgi:hypothetical protein